MTQIYYRANLGDAEFPFISEFQGKTVIQGTIDQNYQQTMFGDNPANDKGIPEAYYMHNVLPSIQGYKSVAYISALAAITGVDDVTRVFAVKDFSGNRAHIAITASGKTYISTSLDSSWTDITPTGQPINGDVTSADASGASFICYASWGIYTVDIANKTLTPTAISWDSPLTNANMVGIAASNNYLLAHDGATLYWSSSLDVLDFKASQITGAGSGTPTSARGAIVTLSPVSVGFAIYCQGNIVVATFSGNVQYPWIFKEAPNGSGILSIYHVSNTGDDASNYAWTSAGLLKVTLGGCTPVHPGASDFLGGKIFEDFDNLTSTLTTTYLTSPLKIRIAYVASRYLVLSYGLTSLTHAIVYDSSIKRWGKLKVAHSQIFDVAYNLNPSIPYFSYLDLGDAMYADYTRTSFLQLNAEQSSIAADAKHSIGAIGADGSIKTLNLDYGVFDTDAVLLLGKYQIFRLNTLAVQEFSLETIEADDTNFTVKVLTSYDGKNVGKTTIPYEIVGANIRHYQCLTTGLNHSLLIQGGFHLTAVVMILTKNGNR